MEKTNLQLIELIGKDFQAIHKKVSTIRERKIKKVEDLDQIIQKAMDFVANLLLEKHFFFQHQIMLERSKPKENQDEKKIGDLLKKFEKVTKEANKFISENKLKQWYAKSFRSMGRVADYKGEYQKAIFYYKKALKLNKYDPEFFKEGVPRPLEYQAFIAFSTLMGGDVKGGLELARKVYKRFDVGNGMWLKKDDYPTWAIWKTGIPMRIIGGLLDKKAEFDKWEMKTWLDDAARLLKVPKTSKRLGKVDFGFRITEIEAVRRRLG